MDNSYAWVTENLHRTEGGKRSFIHADIRNIKSDIQLDLLSESRFLAMEAFIKSISSVLLLTSLPSIVRTVTHVALSKNYFIYD